MDMPVQTTPQWMLDLKEGDIFEMPGLMQGLDPQEPIVFKVLEVVNVSQIGHHHRQYRVTVHAYYHDVFLASGGTFVGVDVIPSWSFK